MKKSKREKAMIETSRMVSMSLFYLTLFLIILMLCTGGWGILAIATTFMSTIAAFIGQNILINVTILSALLGLAFANFILSLDKYELTVKQIVRTLVGCVFPLAVLIVVAIKVIYVVPIAIVFTLIFTAILKFVK